MANRHTHKKLRNEIQARMLADGVSYQRALQAIMSERDELTTTDQVDLIFATYFGVPVTLATMDTIGRNALLVMASGLPHSPDRRPFPSSPLLGALRTRGVQ